MIEGTKVKELQERHQQQAYNSSTAFGGGSSTMIYGGSFGGFGSAMPRKEGNDAQPDGLFGASFSISSIPVASVTTSGTTTHVAPPEAHSAKTLLPEIGVTSRHERGVVDVDYTKIPAMLDSRFEQYGKGNVIRPTIIHPGSIWSKKSQKSLLSKPEDSTLDEDKQRSEKTKAFDLLDALTKSGALTVDHASLHIVMAATHCFDKTLLDTVVQDNVNPIERVEKSVLIMAATVHGQNVSELVTSDSLGRISNAHPLLITDLLSS